MIILKLALALIGIAATWKLVMWYCSDDEDDNNDTYRGLYI